MLGIGIYRLMKKITFIHISDVLLGALPDRECVWSGERKNEIYMTFEAVVARAGELDVDFLLVAGNLFDHQPSEEELAWLDEIFGSLKHTVVIYAAGFQDNLGSDAPLLDYGFKSRVCVIGSPGIRQIGDKQTGDMGYTAVRDEQATMALDHIHFPDKDVDIYGVSYFDRKMDARVVDDAEPQDEAVRNVLIACGGDRRRMPVDWNRLRASGFNYIAFGGRQKYQMKIPGKAYYSGSPEAVSRESTGAHGYIYGEMSDGVVSTKFVPAAVREYKRIDYPVDNDTRDGALTEAILGILELEGRDNIYSICLNRMAGCEKNFDISSMLKDYRILTVEGERFERSDYSEYARANKNTEFGRLLDKLNVADLESRDGIKLAVDMMIEVSGLYARSGRKMGRELYHDTLRQVRQILRMKCQTYEADAAVREYMSLQNDYEVSSDVLGELNSVWAQERKSELEITTLRRHLEELPKEYRRSWIRTGVRTALVPLMVLGILSIVIMYALVARGDNILPDGRLVYAMLFAVGAAGLAYYIGYALSKYWGLWKKSGRKRLTAELEESRAELDKLCAQRDKIHSRRTGLQSLDGRRRDIYEKLTHREKLLDEKLQEIRVMRCAIDELDGLSS